MYTKTVARSSAEVESTVAVKCGCETLGVTQLAQEWGVSLLGSLVIDSSSALAAVKRTGAGKLRHVRVGHVWIQQKEEDKELGCGKLAGDKNPADMMTKAMLAELISIYSYWVGFVLKEGRAQGLQIG